MTRYDGVSPANLAWVDAAVCSQTDLDAFFPEKGGGVVAAKTICAACPVSRQCLEYALTNNVQYGIWGGVTAQGRARLRRGAA